MNINRGVAISKLLNDEFKRSIFDNFLKSTNHNMIKSIRHDLKI